MDIKINLPKNDFFEEKSKQLNIIDAQARLSHEDCVRILNKLNLGELMEELDKNQDTQSKELNFEAKVGFNHFMEWIYFKDCFNQIQRFLHEKLGAKKIETFRSYGCFQIQLDQKLSKIFQ